MRNKINQLEDKIVTQNEVIKIIHQEIQEIKNNCKSNHTEKPNPWTNHPNQSKPNQTKDNKEYPKLSKNKNNTTNEDDNNQNEPTTDNEYNEDDK